TPARRITSRPALIASANFWNEARARATSAKSSTGHIVAKNISVGPGPWRISELARAAFAGGRLQARVCPALMVVRKRRFYVAGNCALLFADHAEELCRCGRIFPRKLHRLV